MDALTNYECDELYSRDYTPAYNSLIEARAVEAGPDEPIDLGDMKDHLHIPLTNEDEDDKLYKLIKARRKALEKFLGVSLVPKTITAIINNRLGNMELPYGPVTSLTSITNKEGTVLTSEQYLLKGVAFQVLEYPKTYELTVVYAAGYAAGEVPEDLVEELTEDITYYFTNRGDQNLPPRPWGPAAYAHRRIPIIF